MGRKKKNHAPAHMTAHEHGGFVSLFMDQLNSPAYISLSPVAKEMFIIMRQEIRSWNSPNEVVCTYSDFVEKGVSRNSITDNLRMLEALGFISYESGGFGHKPNRYFFSDKWKAIKTKEEAKVILTKLKEEKLHRQESRAKLHNERPP